jgi:hypothetical protein
MGISVIGGGAASASPIKSIQRGVTTSATTVTISAVNTAKSFVTSFSNASTGNVSGSNSNTPSGNPGYTSSVNFGTDWAAKSFGAYLSSGTQLVTTGPVRWEVIEYV